MEAVGLVGVEVGDRSERGATRVDKNKNRSMPLLKALQPTLQYLFVSRPGKKLQKVY